MKTEFVPRVNQVKQMDCKIEIAVRKLLTISIHFQLDALQLDYDIVRIVREQLLNAVQSVSVSFGFAHDLWLQWYCYCVDPL